MKTYGEVQVKLNGLGIDEFGDRAEIAAANGWTRDRSKDEEMTRTGGGKWFTFTLAHHKVLPPAFLFLTEKSPDILYVPNVISPARNRLDHAEYNAILDSFCDDVLARLQPPNSIGFNLTGTTIDLATQLPPEVYQRLRAFSVAANKNTGGSHPYDRDRWMDFLIEAVDTHTALDSHTLSRWLIEEEDWDPEHASHLADEYEFGRKLLERRRRAS